MFDDCCALIVFGGSQMGKSTFINMILSDGQCPAAIGDGSGESTTRDVTVYKTRLGMMVVDCPGYDDTDLLIGMEDIGMHVAIALTTTQVATVKFLVFDSVAHSSIQLEKTLLELFTAFGDRCRSSIVVIASKRDQVNERILDARLNKLRHHMTNVDIGNSLVTWKSVNISETEFEGQLRLLTYMLAKVSSTPSTELQILTGRIKEKAMEMFSDQPRSMETWVTESYPVDYTAVEWYDETYYENEQQSMLDRSAQENVALTAVFGIFTFGIGTLAQALTPVDNWVAKTRHVSKEVTMTKTEYRTIQKDVPIEKKPVENFYDIARQIVIDDVRRQLRVGSTNS